MTEIQAIDLEGEVTVSEQVIAYARSLAPCIDSIEVGTPKWHDLIAILKSARRTLEARTVTGGVKEISAGAWTKRMFSRDELGSAFGVDDLTALRNLCRGSVSSTGPVGHFPPVRDLRGLFP